MDEVHYYTRAFIRSRLPPELRRLRVIESPATWPCLLSRVSVFQKEFEEREKSKEDVYFNVFLALYWIAKEEIANTKFTSLLEVVEKMG